MSDTLLLPSRLRLPLAEKDEILRERLFARLDQGLISKLSLVTAPAG